MDLAIAVAVGSSMQIALLVIPLIVILGWALGIDEMNLYFDGFQVMILFVSVLLVNYLIQDGKSNYLEGNLLLSLYFIIACDFSCPTQPRSRELMLEKQTGWPAGSIRTTERLRRRSRAPSCDPGGYLRVWGGMGCGVGWRRWR